MKLKGIYALKVLFKDVFELVSKKSGRKFLLLCLKYGDFKRFKTKKTKLFNQSFIFVDNLSFLWQFFEIFHKHYYWFPTEKKDPVVFDCGANIGLASIYFKKLYPQCKLVAFEPDPEISKIYELNTSGHGNMTFIPKAVWIHNDGISLVQTGSDTGYVSQSGQGVKVGTVRLKDHLQQYEEVDMLKIDIEGAEVEVLKDCKEELKIVRNLFIEYHAEANKLQMSVIIAILEELGFNYQINNENKYLQYPLKGLTEGVRKGQMLFQLNIFATRKL